ncbi:galactose-binding domain-like protein [Mrakia frigida]|uniref:galactose-binding domain-like protein n=1 Tax=Mrakia frigida TaxID=29902 RepID=UPI003FCC273A
MSYKILPLADFDSVLGNTSTEVSSVALGGKVLDCSDDFFAPASDLLEVPPAPSLKGQFGPNGSLFSGWESRRHNPDHDWTIIKLGPPAALLKGFDIDTAWFSGNEAPAASVDGIYSPDAIPTKDSAWTSLLPQVPLGPSSRHLFTIPTTTSSFTHLRLNMYPDGGIARFRAYGIVAPTWASAQAWDRTDMGEVDLAHAFNGGRLVFESDKHYGTGANLLLPGRGKDMGDGWETKRSRTPNHLDFVVIKLGSPGTINEVNIDTLHFKGNFPSGVEIHAINSEEDLPPLTLEGWTKLLDRSKVGPHAEHFFKIEAGKERVFTHVRMTIYPDGGVKRLRVFGNRVGAESSSSSSSKSAPGLSAVLPTSISSLLSKSTSSETTTPSPKPATIATEPFTAASFAPYGTVIQAYPSPSDAPPSVAVTTANAGSAFKFHRLSLPESSYPKGSGEVTAISCFRATPPEGFGKEVKGGEREWEVRMFERHCFTTQSFIPMGKTDGDLPKGGEGMLVIVALNGADDKPDPSTIKAFLASPSQGLTYNIGVWR